MAGKLFAWVAQYVRDESKRKSKLNPEARNTEGSYLPPSKKGGLGTGSDEAGKLKKISVNMKQVIQGFVDQEKISQNGWPHPFTAADHVHAAIEWRDPTAFRKLELLLAGYSTGRLKVKENRGGDPNRFL